MNLNKKSRGTAFVLTLLFGPLGLLYASAGGGFALIVIALATAPTVIGPILCWLGAMAWADHAAQKHNQSVDMLLANAGASTASQSQEATATSYSAGHQSGPGSGQAPQTQKTTIPILGVTAGELVFYVVVLVIVMVVIPMWLGREPDESTLHFYLRLLEGA